MFSWTSVYDSTTLPGIMAHKRWAHSDGVFIEHYVLCRFNDMSQSDAYKVTLERASSGKIYTEIPK